MDSIAVASSDAAIFDPKEKQKAIYLYYDSQYSDEALDIYSEEWQQRILYWHQKAIDSAATTLSSEKILENLDFGGFFLAHPIAAFSLWQLLQSCYELDVAVCGNSKADLNEIESWQKMNPFKYLRDRSVQDKWRASLELFKAQIKAKSEDIDVQEESWELRMHDILIGVEKFETAFESLQENFKANLAGKRFADWMIARIDEDIGKRFSMIHRLLEFKESELGDANFAEDTDEPGPCKWNQRYTLHANANLTQWTLHKQTFMLLLKLRNLKRGGLSERIKINDGGHLVSRIISQGAFIF
jgi:hypothetical protein